MEQTVFCHLCKGTCILCFFFFYRQVTTAGCVARTVTVRNSGSSTSPRKNTKSVFSTRRTIRTAGSTAFPRARLKFARGELMSVLAGGAREAVCRSAGRMFLLPSQS